VTDALDLPLVLPALAEAKAAGLEVAFLVGIGGQTEPTKQKEGKAG
jgi:hypothetical protein